MRKTKIIATIGPSCGNKEKLQLLIHKGVDVFRINASHIAPESLKKWIRLIRTSASSINKSIAVLLDLQGPRVRTGPLKDKIPLELQRGDRVTIVSSSRPGADKTITTACRPFAKMVKRGDPVLLDNGYLELKAIKILKNKVECRVIVGGVLGENKGINLPNAPITLPALTHNDRLCLKHSVKSGVDYIALSFVRSGKDIEEVKKYLKKIRADIPIIAKIEKPRALEHIDSIMEAADGIMVARGDLGIELGIQKVPLIQKELISKANRKGIAVITATQMLESMMQHSQPTRAEASDIANAVLDGTDAVMLSGETAIGKYPVESVHVMSQIILDAERIEPTRSSFLSNDEREGPSPLHAITHAAQYAAYDSGAKAIVAYTHSGKTAVLISKLERSFLTLALVPDENVCRRLILLRGVVPLKIHYPKRAEDILLEGDQAVLRRKLLKKGDLIVIVSGKQAIPAARYMLKIHRIGDIKFNDPSS